MTRRRLSMAILVVGLTWTVAIVVAARMLNSPPTTFEVLGSGAIVGLGIALADLRGPRDPR